MPGSVLSALQAWSNLLPYEMNTALWEKNLCYPRFTVRETKALRKLVTRLVRQSGSLAHTLSQPTKLPMWVGVCHLKRRLRVPSVTWKSTVHAKAQRWGRWVGPDPTGHCVPGWGTYTLLWRWWGNYWWILIGELHAQICLQKRAFWLQHGGWSEEVALWWQRNDKGLN